MKMPTFEVLLVDPDELTKFLYSCAYTELMAASTTVITESTGLLWGLGHAIGLPGGSATRVTETMSTNERRALAVAAHARLLAQYKELLDKPREQVKFLLDLNRRREQQRAKLDNMFAQAALANEQTDAALAAGAKGANDVQAVACIALAVLAPGGALVNAGRAAVVILGTKSIIAVAQTERSWGDLWGFAIGTFKDGAITLGELSTKAFELVKDVAIEGSRSRMAMATSNYLKEMSDISQRIARLQTNVWTAQTKLWMARPGSDNARFLKHIMESQSRELAAAQAEMTQLGRNAVAASKTGQFMKNFGGKAVPLVFVAIDTVLEYQRWQEVNAQIGRGR
jgi:hypothetical protein